MPPALSAALLDDKTMSADGIARVYVSSPSRDLQDYRQAAIDAIHSLGHQAVAMEHYGAVNQTAVEKCLADVQNCQAYVGILAWRYGSIPEGYEQSITELEYREAEKHNIPRFLFLLGEDAPWPRTAMDNPSNRVEKLRHEWMRNRVVAFFINKDSLASEIKSALARGLTLQSGNPSRSQAVARDTTPAPQDMTPFLPELLRLLADIEVSDSIIKGTYDACAPEGAPELTYRQATADLLSRAASALAKIPQPWPGPPPLFTFVRLILCHAADQKVQKLHEWLDRSLSRLARESASNAGPASVRLAFPVETGHARRTKELPFVIGVMADLSGGLRSAGPRKVRGFEVVHQNNFRQTLSAWRPRLRLSVPNRLAEDGAPPLELELDFEELEDFTPDRIVERVEPLRDLCALRRRALGGSDTDTGDRCQRDSAGGDGQAGDRAWDITRKLTAQLREILHHPAFRKLEAAWRGLHYLVHQIGSQAEGGSEVVVRVWDVSKQELFNDIARAAELKWSILFQKVYDEEFGQPGGEPFGLLVGDFFFGFNSEDVELLENIAGVAAASYAPFVGGVSAEFFQLDRFSQKGALRALTLGFDGTDYLKWRDFQKSENSRFVGLPCPVCYAGFLTANPPAPSRRSPSRSSALTSRQTTTPG
jgi:type VI secretion system ImpB/VipA family protein